MVLRAASVVVAAVTVIFAPSGGFELLWLLVDLVRGYKVTPPPRSARLVKDATLYSSHSVHDSQRP